VQYKVPQNIDKQDEIVGPLTIIQFSYLAVAFAIDFLLFKSMPRFTSIMLMIPISLVAIGLAFVKVNDKPLLEFLFAMFKFFRQPKIRIWHKTSDEPILTISHTKETKVDAPIRKEFNQNKINELSQTLDTGGEASASPKMPFTNVDSKKLDAKAEEQS
jgi:hypothetical protein